MQYEQVQALVSSLEKKKQRAEGALAQVVRQLKTEFGVESLEAGQKCLSDLLEKERLLQIKFDKGLVAFEKQYGHLLENE